MFKLVLGVCLLAVIQSEVSSKASIAPQDPTRADLPTVYEYFAADGYNSGLEATPEGFVLNGKPLRIISGAIHYFRVPPTLWRDRLRKLRATGANTVETYVAWNLHEPQKDVYDFGDGNNDFSAFLNLKRYIQIAQEEDLLVLFRPGPYICSEWDFGGLPSWIQRDPNVLVRQNNPQYLERVDKYYKELFAQVVDLQFTRGGPIIGLQIENEYGSFDPVSKDYVQHLVDLVKELGFSKTLLYTSDGVGNKDRGTLLDQLLYTVNFQGNPEGNLNALRDLQPNKPLMVMEYWSGWFDHWFEDHHRVDEKFFGDTLETILGNKYNASVNFYMFHGGTNFGFMAGANSGSDAPGYYSDVTSYDYDAPLSEAGDYTAKYYKAMEIIEKYETPKLSRPVLPAVTSRKNYPAVKPTKYLSYLDILSQVPADAQSTVFEPTSMEDLNMNGGSGQSYGYIIHRAVFRGRGDHIYKAGPVKDFAYLLVNGNIEQGSFAGSGSGRYWINSEREVAFNLDTDDFVYVDLLVENMARVNFGWAEDFRQKKGLPNATATIDGTKPSVFRVYALEFKSAWVNNLQNFRETDDISKVKAPLIAQSTFEITGTPTDTFVDLTGWEKGIVFINGFNLGRYWDQGPQQTLYVPAPLLKVGQNTLTIFEQLSAGAQVTFTDTPNLGSKVQKNAPVARTRRNNNSL